MLKERINPVISQICCWFACLFRLVSLLVPVNNFFIFGQVSHCINSWLLSISSLNFFLGQANPFSGNSSSQYCKGGDNDDERETWKHDGPPLVLSKQILCSYCGKHCSPAG